MVLMNNYVFDNKMILNFFTLTIYINRTKISRFKLKKIIKKKKKRKG